MATPDGIPRRFLPTAWTQVISARDGAGEDGREALDHLIRAYWKPVYFQVRRRGHDAERAKDLTQGFFAMLLQREALKSVTPEKGKFRTFLLACLRNFLADEAERHKAVKREIPLDFDAAEAGYAGDHSFERDWALTVLERAFSRLKDLAPREARAVEAQRSGNTPYAELAAEMETSEANVKVMAHRGRKRLKAILLEELRSTVAEDGAESDELKELFRAISL